MHACFRLRTDVLHQNRACDPFPWVGRSVCRRATLTDQGKLTKLNIAGIQKLELQRIDLGVIAVAAILATATDFQVIALVGLQKLQPI